MFEIDVFSTILGFPRFPLHWKHHEKCMELMHFQWFSAPHVSHFIKEIIKNVRIENHAFSKILGFPRFPLHWKYYEKCMDIMHFQWFWAPHASHFTGEIIQMMEILTLSMILGSHASHAIKKSWKMYGNLFFFSVSGLHTLPTPPKKSWRMCGNLCICNDCGLPTPPTPPKKL